MNVIIDTNILYYLSNLYESKYDAPLLLKLLKENYETILISDFSILEMNTKFYKKRDKLIYLINFMNSNNIGVHLNLNKEHQIIDGNTIKQLDNLENFNEYVEKSVNKRKEIELTYLSFFITTISSIYLATKIEEQNISSISADFKTNIFSFFYESTLDDGESRRKISNILIKKYNGGSDRDFNNSIIDLIVDNCVELYLLLNLAEKNINIFDAINDSLSPEEKKQMLELQTKSEFTRLQKRKQKERSLVKNEFVDILRNNLARFEAILSEKIPQTQIKYFVNLFSGILLTKEKVIRKNDILDSLIASNYPKEIFLTADTNLQNRIIEIYPEYETLIKETLYKCKK